MATSNDGPCGIEEKSSGYKGLKRKKKMPTNIALNFILSSAVHRVMYVTFPTKISGALVWVDWIQLF